jgi:hypothetical protein
MSANDPAKPWRLERFAQWVERITRPAYEDDKPKFEAEGLAIVMRDVPARVTEVHPLRAGTYWTDVTVVVTQ